MSAGALEIGHMLGVTVTLHELHREEDIAPAVEQARDEGAGIIVGGYITAEIARNMGMACQPVEAVAQGILAAVDEASIVRARAVSAKGQLLRAVVTGSGTCWPWTGGHVTVINRAPRACCASARRTPPAGPCRALASARARQVLAAARARRGVERLFDPRVRRSHPSTATVGPPPSTTCARSSG
jgi:hypothetical protein